MTEEIIEEIEEVEIEEDYGAHQDAQAHMKKAGADPADHQKYSDHHMAKRGYTHRSGLMYKKGTPHEGPFSNPATKIKVDPHLTKTEETVVDKYANFIANQAKTHHIMRS